METLIRMGRNLIGLIISVELLLAVVAISYRRDVAAESTISVEGSAPVVLSVESNSAGAIYGIDFSVPSGFYTEDFSLALSAPDGFSIYYTLDGSIPTIYSSLYTWPIPVHIQDALLYEEIPKATIIRAVAVDDAGVSTDIFTATYLADSPYITDDRVLISVVSDPTNFLDPDTGIYVAGTQYETHVAIGGDPADDSMANYRMTGHSWERPAHIDYFDMDRTYLFSQETGVRIHGDSSRSDYQKSLRLYARKEYDGNSLFTYDFFGNNSYANSIILRRGSFLNQFLPALVSDRAVSTQDYIPCILYLNGIYWGDYNLLERYDAEYFEGHFNIPSKHIAILKDGILVEGSIASAESYLALYNYMAENDLSIPENYDYVCSQLDIESYIDCYCAQLYINNCDFYEGKNMVLWRSEESSTLTPYADGKWRFCITDTDQSLTFGVNEGYWTNSFNDPYSLVKTVDETMFHALLANPEFRRQFVTTFLDMEQICFDYDTVVSQLDTLSIYFENAGAVEAIKEFFEHRPDHINRYLAETFDLEGVLADVTLTTSAPNTGEILLNSITPDLTYGSWRGQYYTDYPVTVTALPAEGFRFESWSINGKTYTEETLTLPLPESGLQISATYVPE